MERHQDVDIALGPEIVAHHRPEEGELGHLPLAAKGVDSVLRNRDPRCAHARALASIVASSTAARMTPLASHRSVTSTNAHRPKPLWLRKSGDMGQSAGSIFNRAPASSSVNT